MNAPLMVQISRGMAPAHAIASMILGAQRHGWGYQLVAGLPALEAKNEAVRIAYDARNDLVLVEDDVIVPWDIWPSASDAIYAADICCADGVRNTAYSSGGAVVCTGTCFVRIPLWAIERMGYPTEPLFASKMFIRTACGLVPDHSRAPTGDRSDMHLYWRAAESRVPVRIFGSGINLVHAASGCATNVSEIRAVG